MRSSALFRWRDSVHPSILISDMRAAHRSFSDTIFRLVRLFAVAGQLVFCVAPLAEQSHGQSNAVSHVEPQGVDMHYVHDEATCLACTMLTVYARKESLTRSVFVVTVLSRWQPQSYSTIVLAGTTPRANPSRAPPVTG